MRDCPKCGKAAGYERWWITLRNVAQGVKEYACAACNRAWRTT